MPAELWAEAVSLARSGGTYRTARALGINYQSLAKRVAEAVGKDGGAGSTGGFVELSGAQLLGVSASRGVVVEVADGNGVRLTIRLPGGEALDVVGLVHGFCQRPA